MSDNRRVDFADLRARADFRTVLAHYGIAIKGAGDQVKALCPLHDDERPSLSIHLGEKVFHCYAPSCPGHDGGDILAFVHLMETHRGSSGSLRQAGIRLAEICGLSTGSESAPPRRQEGRGSARRRERARISARTPDAAPGPPQAPETASPERNRPFNRTLTLDPAHPYLTERGLSPALINT